MENQMDRFKRILKRAERDAKGDTTRKIRLSRLYSSREGQFKQEQKQLEKQYQWVCKNVFPDWKKSKDWVVAIQIGNIERTGLARCYLKLGLINVHHFCLDIDGSGLLEYPLTVRRLLIHEICHAINEEQGVLMPDHAGGDFQGEMLKAFCRIDKLEEQKPLNQFWGKHFEKLIVEAFWFRDPDVYETYEDFECDCSDDLLDVRLSQAVAEDALRHLDIPTWRDYWIKRYNDCIFAQELVDDED